MITRGQAAGREKVVTLKSRVLWLTLCQQLDALRFRDAVVQHFPRIAQVELKDLPTAVHHYAVAMLILDIGIPTNAELNVVRFCRDHFPHVPLVVLTHDRSHDLELWLRRMHVWDVIAKPCDPARLARCLSQHCESASNAPSTTHAFDVDALATHALPRTLASGRNAILMGGGKAPTRSTQAALLYIAQHYARPLTLDDVARVCGLSPGEFCRRFQSENGIGFKQYLLNVRMQRAEELLAHTTKSIIDIAHATGFGSHSHFTRSFRERRGVTPTVWRTQQRAALREKSHTEGSTPPPETAS